ncbi:MAG: DNA ligase D [Gemmatimonadaceae bacterium]|nr:DNA ligase D [Gemmatimonadaceae bacterium]
MPPALATRVERPPAGDDWYHEIKYDGYRLQASVSGEAVRLYTRAGLDWTHTFPGIARSLAALDLADVLLDGEVAVATPDGRTDFSALQQSLKAGANDVSYFIFDLLALGNDDLRAKPLAERRGALEAVLAHGAAPLHISPVFAGEGATVLAAFAERGLEGVVSKQRDAPYLSGRTASWQKAKLVNVQEFVIVGWLPSERHRPFASLLLADRVDGRLTYRGNVGSGFDEPTLVSLQRRLSALARATPPLDVPRDVARRARWVSPTLVAQVRFTEFTRDGFARHGVFLGLREDKPAREVRSEVPTKGSTNRSAVRLTHPERVLFPVAGITKGELAEYFARVAGRMGPHAFRRAVSIVRAPDGVGKVTFFQRHPTEGIPSEIAVVPVTARNGSTEDYLALPNARALEACAQLSVVELHLSGARIDAPERPDRLVFDLDPDEGLPFAHVRRAALDIKSLLDSANLPSFAMLTGGKGIHVVLNLRRRHGWDELKDFATAFATQVAALDPKRFVANLSKARREGRIFVDYLRNQRGATAIAPYSPRAQPEAPVATPVAWDELETLDTARAFTMRDLDERLRQDDPWAEFARRAVTLTAAVRSKLGLRSSA